MSDNDPYEFQFLTVRLKHAGRCSRRQPVRISIPHGPIEAVGNFHRELFHALFQFLTVRLKREKYNVYLNGVKNFNSSRSD